MLSTLGGHGRALTPLLLAACLCVAVAVVHGKAFAGVACGFVVCFARLVQATREAPFSIARKRAAVFLVVIVTFVVAATHFIIELLT